MQDNIHINSNKNSAKTPSANSTTSSSVISLGELSPDPTTLSSLLATRPLIRTFIPLLIALGLLSLDFLILTMSRTHAETATASVTVPVSCTMTASPSSEHTTTMNNGTYNEVAAETTLGAACNDNGGYSIYAVGYSDNASGNTNSTSMIGPSISGTSLTIPTCTLANCTSTTPDVSRWAMKLTSISGTSTPTILGDYNNYSPIPLEPTKVITYPAITATDNRSETKATYAVAISSTQPSGTYTGKVKYTIVHPNYANADGSIVKGVNFIATNGAKIIVNGTQYANGTSATIDAGTYTISGSYPEGYEFDSWSVEGGTLGSATTDPTTLSFTGPLTLTLNTKVSCTDILSGNMQDWITPASLVCDGATGTMTDTRSGNIQYTVAKIVDLIWMTRNLDLPGGTTLTSADSNVSNGYVLPASSSSKKNFSDPSTAYVYNSGNVACSDDPCYSYYSYAAATAGTNPSSGEAASDICPKGWRLPTKTEYDTLIGAYTTGAALTTSPFYAVYSGSMEAGPFEGSSYGGLWSSTSYDSSSAYRVEFTNYSEPSVSKEYGGGKGRGWGVRCVAKA